MLGNACLICAGIAVSVNCGWLLRLALDHLSYPQLTWVIASSLLTIRLTRSTSFVVRKESGFPVHYLLVSTRSMTWILGAIFWRPGRSFRVSYLWSSRRSNCVHQGRGSCTLRCLGTVTGCAYIFSAFDGDAALASSLRFILATLYTLGEIKSFQND